MSLRRLTRATLASLLTAALAATAATLAAPASADEPTGTSSLAALLASDGDQFDRNWHDYDILDQAVAAVLAAKPDSPVAVLADGTVPLTAFLPNDRAFQLLSLDLTRRVDFTEQGVLNRLAGAAGIDTIEAVLLYHVIPGATIDSAAAVQSDGAVLQTALPDATVTVDVLAARAAIVRLVDNDPTDVDPFLIRRQLDLNEGNVQIAHGITFVLRPLDLP